MSNVLNKVYYDRNQDTKEFTFYRIEKVYTNIKTRVSGVKDSLLDIIDYKLDYEKNELVENGSGMMWLSCLKEDYNPLTKTIYYNIVKNVKAKHGKNKMRYLYKIEVK